MERRICSSVPVMVLGGRFESELRLQLSRRYRWVGGLHDEVILVRVGSDPHPPRIRIQQAIRNGVVEVIVGYHEIQIQIADGEIYVRVQSRPQRARRGQ